jgi:pyruvate ferredoxin oxidoreductase gamma subunit
MAKMLEVRFHGRGGQGAKTAADLLATTALETGKYIQAFPEYGPERAGAPMKSFTRISDEPIYLHCGVTNPDIVLVIDPTLLETIDVTEGLGDNGILMVNTEDTPGTVRKKVNFKNGKVFTVNATKIALETIGSPLPNTPMLGALLKAVEIVPVDKLKQSVKDKFLKKIGEAKVQGNLDSIDRAFKEAVSG